MHYCLSVAFAKGAIEAAAVVLREIVPDEGLAAVLVDTLEDLSGLDNAFSMNPHRAYLVASSIPQTREER